MTSFDNAILREPTLDCRIQGKTPLRETGSRNKKQKAKGDRTGKKDNLRKKKKDGRAEATLYCHPVAGGQSER